MADPEVPDLRPRGLLGWLIPIALGLKLGAGLLLLGASAAMALRGDRTASLLLLGLGLAVLLPLLAWLQAQGSARSADQESSENGSEK